MALNEQQAIQWAEGFLNYLGAPAQGPDDARVKFLVAQAMHEGTNATNNPLAITKAEGVKASDLAGNTAGVKNFTHVQDGYVALHRYLVNQGITPYLTALLNPKTTVQQLTNALSQSNWEGSATSAARQASLNYATSIGQAAGGVVVNNSGASANQSGGATSGAAPTVPALTGLDQTYKGVGAYKGFDLHSLAGDLIGPAKKAINQYLKTPGLETKVLQDIYTNYGLEAWAASNPEVRTLLVVGSLLGWDKDPAIFNAQLQRTQWWKSTSDNMRMWDQVSANDPGQAKQAVAEAQSRVMNIANSLGVQLDANTLHQIATTVAQQSVTSTGVYSNTQFTDQQIYQMVAGHFNATTFLQSAQQTQAGSTGQPTTPGAQAAASNPVTSPNTSGDAAALFNAFSTINRNYYLGLSPQDIANQVQKYMTSDTGEGNFQSGAIAGFTTFAEQQAKIKYPALGSILGPTSTASGTNNTPYESLAWARNMIAQYTGLGSGDNVDLTSPQWSWVLGQGQPPSSRATGLLTGAQTGNAGNIGSGNSANATPAIPSADQLQTYLMGTPQFQSTNMAKNMAWGVGNQILKAFGYN
jgi:hypothetical protein